MDSKASKLVKKFKNRYKFLKDDSLMTIFKFIKEREKNYLKY